MRLRHYPLFLAAIFICPVLVGADDETAPTLQYQVDVPIAQRSRAQLDINVQREGDPLQLSVYQDVNAHLTLDQPLTTSPYELTFTLNRLRVGLDIGERELRFDSGSPDSSLFLMALSKVIDQPIHLSVGENLQILNAPVVLQKLMNDLKFMGGFTINSLIAEMVQQRFVLANQSLEVGKSYQHVLRKGGNEKAAVELTYRIVEISPTEVRAIVDGTIPESAIPFNIGALGFDDSAATVKVTGNINGKVVWDRDNALLYRSKLKYLYRGVIAHEGREVPFEVHMTHQDFSTTDNENPQ